MAAVRAAHKDGLIDKAGIVVQPPRQAQVKPAIPASYLYPSILSIDDLYF